MARKRQHPIHDIDEDDLRVRPPKDSAVGIPGIAVAMKRTIGSMGPVRTAKSLLKLNHADGFDCQGCAWPDPEPGHRHTAEFCENGAKAVAEEATNRHVLPEFFATHSIDELEQHTDYWLGQQGRLVHPVVRRRDATHYEPISWDDAFALIGETLNGLDDPDEAIFYTSGRTSNEAAFAYQLFARQLGTNNLPDCSNMCHESTGTALAEAIGIGKGSVSLQDIHEAELIVISGQNPGTNHPRMLSALEIAKSNGAKILAINPLPEAGLLKFDNPQTPRGLSGVGTALADLHLPVRINGDLALWQAFGLLLLEEDERRGGGVLDRDFIEQHTSGFAEWAEQIRALDWALVERATGLERARIEEAARMLMDSGATVNCWAMGITQHRNAVATIKEFTNVALLQGNIGKPGAGLCPVRGHSNVQGDRTMGIWERVPQHFLDALEEEYGFRPPQEDGWDTVDSIRALRDGKAKVFVGMGGNFVSAAPDTVVTEEAMMNADLTVQVSTKLNRSHVRCGRTALILPPLGRSEKDRTGGIDQRVTVEDSMSAVHASRGPLTPASGHLRSEVDIICSIAEATLGTDGPVPWSDYRADYRNIRRAISRVVPGCAAYDEKVDRPGGFVLPHPPRDSRTFPTETGKAIFTPVPLEVIDVPEGRLLLQSLRSHDQFNTTIYGLDDRYRGISRGRRVVFMHRDDIAALGHEDGDIVDLVSEWTDGTERSAPAFRIVEYDTPRGCAAAYYPEANPLVPLDSTAEGSNCPTSKSVVIRLQRPSGGGASSEGRGAPIGSDRGHKTDVEPQQLS
ncbi:FdhF/YdeP family oxidoreductase [Nocardioides sp. JQ2195]|uniref:FdhF/YdeP family oxidoreductase n=1 Tax=Nocardioides sp. JQ2195 TaxID=2592334 RepID=UPI00143E7D46|nr:FdhF/YdeP family oxidoreductase [Nocardioides sp. JQ2195]QIX27259.1 FdhF/YdeP family oxidoreductase [Nocardioides sp. JQ2195]